MSDVETINELTDKERIAAIAQRAAQLESEARYDPAGAKARATDLLAQLPPGAPGSVIALVERAIAAADQYAAEAEADEGSSLGNGGPTGALSMNFQSQVYRFMSKGEQQFFNSLDSNTQYKMSRINEDGSIEPTDKTVSGAQLKEDFARVKYHTLSDEERAGITTPEGQKSSEMTASQQIKELDKLNDSLDNLEGHKAEQLMEENASPDECKRCHQKFSGARDQVERLRDRIERAQELRGQGRNQEANMEKAMIDVDRHKLRTHLQKEVINDALLDKHSEGREHHISGAHHVDDERSAQLAAPQTKMDESVRQQGGRGPHFP